MGITNCEIIHDNESTTFYPGQIINGYIEITFNSMEKCGGEANISWKAIKNIKQENGKMKSVTVHYTGHEQYFKAREFFVRKKEVPPGRHLFPFKYELPSNLPNSFEDNYAHIRYFIHVVAEIPMQPDFEYTYEFKIMSIVDLNKTLPLKEPVNKEVTETISKNLFCLCCKSRPLSLVVSIPSSGYTLNQTIPITVICDNKSFVNVKYVIIILKKEITYYANNPTKESKIVKVPIAQLSTGVVKRGKRVKFDEKLLIPEDCPPSCLENCEFVDVSYMLEFKPVVGGCHSLPESTIKIIIGHIPFEEEIKKVYQKQSEYTTENVSIKTPSLNNVY